MNTTTIVRTRIWSVALLTILGLILGPPSVQAHDPEPVATHALVKAGDDSWGQLASAPYFCDTPVKIMPLGDSITAGASSGVDDPEAWVGYRQYLWNSLNAADYPVDFVGGQTNGQIYAGFDPNHEGHPGWTKGQIAANITTGLNNHSPDVILLHIGTNGVNTSITDIETILDAIDDFEAANNKEIMVILARIINRVGYHQITTDYNDAVETMAQTRIANGDYIILVDMEDGAGLNYAVQPAGDMWDNLHPYTTGYSKMAGVWFAALDEFLDGCIIKAPAITSTAPVTAKVDQPYSYNVEATGNPEPTYSLTVSPPDMTIDPATGLIQWTPTADGSFEVMVVASNLGGDDTQTFSVEVPKKVKLFVPLIVR